MRLEEVVLTGKRVAETRGRNAKIEALAELLGRAGPDDIGTVVAFLTGVLPLGRIGVGYAAVRKASDAPPASTATLSVRGVLEDLERVGATSGSGSAAERQRLLGGLFARATHPEHEFLQRLLTGELRQGALEGVMVEAIAKASRVDAALVRRAAMLASDLGAVASAAMHEGAAGVARFGLTLMRPVQPMLAQTAADVDEALSSLGEAALEWKLDGARIQAHREGDLVRVFSREGNDVTSAVPEVVELVRALPAQKLVLDGEAIALQASGAPQPFQVTMRRFGRKLDVEALRHDLPLSPFLFDALHIDGQDLIDLPLRERLAALDTLVPERARVQRVWTPSPEAADAFYAAAIARGHEGLLAKGGTAPYEAGRRGASWLKIKPAHALDLVVLAVEWGSGRRQGYLSNLHLGARDPQNGGYVMLGKTFKGMTDAMLAWQTEQLLAREIGRDGRVVHVKPELVVEIAFDGVQASSTYPGGMALRFARVKRYREDKTAEQADTIEAVRRLFRSTE